MGQLMIVGIAIFRQDDFSFSETNSSLTSSLRPAQHSKKSNKAPEHHLLPCNCQTKTVVALTTLTQPKTELQTAGPPPPRVEHFLPPSDIIANALNMRLNIFAHFLTALLRAFS